MYRKSNMADCRAIYNLICKLENKTLSYEMFYEIYKEQLNDSRFYCLVCEINNKIIGMLNLRFEGQLHHAGVVAEIMEFIVDESCRKSGIGSALFKGACKIANEEGSTLIEVACNQVRTDSHQFYLKQGMTNSHFKFTKLLLDD